VNSGRLTTVASRPNALAADGRLVLDWDHVEVLARKPA
jgi:hypothetical protein